ncbi:MAG: BLUF domain-containing protein [Oxalobacter sp.]|nr:MAG: BLUF domain-containing protein [Oxalobacter sp.]
MYYCVYTSTASSPLSDQELMNIKVKSRSDCEKSGVTGLLVFHRNTFIHYYEGEKDNVKKVLTSIGKDKRHKDVKPVADGKIKGRQFANASMELRVLDKDPLFPAGDLSADSAGVKQIINDCFMKIT